MRTLAAICAALGALVAAAPAAAKELTRAELCGPAGCAVVTDRAQLPLVPDSEITTGPPPVAPYHELRVTVEHEGQSDTWTIYYIASSNLTVSPGDGGSMTYNRVFGRSTTFMRGLAPRVEPFPAPELTGATVGGKPVKLDPSTLLGLLSARRPAAYPADADWIPITLTTRTTTPWTNVSLTYAPGPGVLLRGEDFVELDGELAAALEASADLDDPGGSFPLWHLVAGAVAGTAVAVLAVAWRRRGRRRLAPVAATAIVAVLALPGLASAKNWGYPQLCGPAGCSARGAALVSLPADDEAAAAPATAPYYELRLGPTWGRVWYVPSARATAVPGGSSFRLVTEVAAETLARLARGVEPFPAPELQGAFVGGRPVSGDPDTHLRLFEVEGVPAANGGDDWVPIDLRSKVDTPWTNSASYLLYSPGGKLLQRGNELIRLDDSVASRVDRAEALRNGSTSLLPWLLLAALVVLMGLLAALAAAIRRLADQRVLASRTA